MTTVTSMPWLTAEDAAVRIRRPAGFVRRVADSGELHGHQRLGPDGRPMPKSRWSFSAAAVDAFVRNADVRAQRAACGCLDEQAQRLACGCARLAVTPPRAGGIR